MKILYITNAEAENKLEIPSFLESKGNKVEIVTRRFCVQDLINQRIDFIVSDKTRFLLGKEILDYLPNKIINLHPSFLPWGRGYHPNFWSIAKNFPHGVTIHKIDEGIDTGEIIAQSRFSYFSHETFRDTYYRQRKYMVDLFRTFWNDSQGLEIKSFPQDKQSGNLFYRKDIEPQMIYLKSGWDTRIIDFFSIRQEYTKIKQD